MKSPRRFTRVAIAALATGLLLGASPATAAAPDRITDPIDYTFMADDFCDIDGLTVEIVRSGEETIQVMKRGPNSPALLLIAWHGRVSVHQHCNRFVLHDQGGVAASGTCT